MEKDKIYNKDCLVGLKELSSKCVDVSFTSPPYNRIRNDTYKYYDDTLSDYYEMLCDVTDQLLRVTKGYSIINIQCNHFNKVQFYSYLGHYAEKINGMFVWQKTNPQPANNIDSEENTRSVTNAYEYFIFIKDGESLKSYGVEPTKNIITTSINSEHFDGHGAVMKFEVADFFIRKFTKVNDLVLDPFMGMGTTAIACIKNSRNYLGYELSNEYWKGCMERIEQYKTSCEVNQHTIWEFIDGNTD